jgi:integrase
LFKQGGAYYLRFRAAELKTRKTKRDIEVPFPKGLVNYLTNYIDLYRPVLLAENHMTDDSGEDTPTKRGLWLSADGRQISAVSIYQRIIELTEDRFGKRINPHLFRDCAATSIAEEDPEHSRIIMTILGHTTLTTSDRHYNQATCVKASADYQLKLLAMRKKGAKLARLPQQRRFQAKI